MTREFFLGMNDASTSQMLDHFTSCDPEFTKRLNSRVEIPLYVEKIHHSAHCFEAWSEKVLVGLVAVYCNELEGQTAFITNVSVIESWQGNRVASKLLEISKQNVLSEGFKYIELEVDTDNCIAIDLYRKMGFIVKKAQGNTLLMILDTGLNDDK